ncbi:MAG: hypothetical protein IJU03_05495 [Thermoguttaceae bacterium]|nr:hypothetical protein [Thermoguttaceae bacterium]
MAQAVRADREKIVDYVLGRMSRSEVETFERRVLETPELSQLVDAARDELVKRGVESERNQPLEDAIRSRLDLVIAANEDAKAAGSPLNALSENGARPADRKRRARRFEFIPKFVEIPQRRDDSQFVFKRATVLSDEERERRRKAARRANRPARSIFSREKTSYSLVDSFPTLASAQYVASQLRSEYFATLDARLRDRLERERLWTETTAPIVDHSALSLRAKRASRAESISLAPTASDVLQFASGVHDTSEPVRVPVRAPSALALATVPSSGVGPYLIAPVEYAQGQTRVAESAILYPFEELGAPTLAPIASASSGVRPRFATASQETVDAVAAAIGQSARILPQRSGAYFAAELDAEDREAIGTTLSAEDKRLAELLGRELTAIDLDEYYWEEVDDGSARSKAKASGLPAGILMKILYVITEPPVLVGRATISLLRSYFPQDLEREEAARETRRRPEDKEQVGRFSDAAISTIVGVLIAVCIVFPLLYRVVEEVYMTVATSVVRRYSQNVVTPQLESNLDVMPFITEQILYPHYDAGEVGTATTGAELESDGLPISN